uniref:DDE_Tnp_1_7 domain-containing protein n=1 Tax=Panagrellus redivivus TaxID=6233 RepID=A0A7E4UP85_PANRE
MRFYACYPNGIPIPSLKVQKYCTIFLSNFFTKSNNPPKTQTMIGMMNGGGDAPVDFYSTRVVKGEKRMYVPQQKEVVSYTPDGRMMLDGQLVVTETPEELWQDLIMRVVWYMLCKDHLKLKEYKMPKDNKIRNFFRFRKLPRLGNGTKKSSDDRKASDTSSTTLTTSVSTDPKTGAKAVTQTATTKGRDGLTKSTTLTSVFIKKQRFCGNATTEPPHMRRIVGQ